MLVSTRGRYGLRSMVDIAINATGGPVPLRAIAERQGISESYLEQVFALLRKAGLVNAIRGSYGGYVLSKPPEDITVGEIILALEGPLVSVNCVTEGEEAACDKKDTCHT
ncbi:MAG: Rrf2 family transcriptional regulator, partial [Firmicutes bacterium]|nr:Rrf2 family transcriptional regulator [Bacillota bacterium]